MPASNARSLSHSRRLVSATLRRLAKNLRRARIPYAVFGGLAVNAHGHKHATDDVDVLLASDGLEDFRRLCSADYENLPTRSGRRFVDRSTNTAVDVVVTGHRPGKDSPVRYPEPNRVAKTMGGVRYVNLSSLIELKLTIGRYRDLANVVTMIRVHDLDESYLTELHVSVHRDFMACLEEVRREKDCQIG